MKLFGIGLAATAVLLAAAAPAADASRRARPTDVPPQAALTEIAPNELQVFNDYATPARAFSSLHVVVHYVVRGIDAPPLNDDDGNDVPDYVERVGEAADTAIAYYARRGFAPILPDEGGPDARPDIYVSRFAAGYFGVAFPSARADGGAFVAVSNALDPSSTRSLGSVYGTVAHELFHLVQFSYYPRSVDPPLAPWALEGTAAAVETRVYPALDDIVSSLQLRRWLGAPQRSLLGESYGAQLLWRFLDERRPRLLPAYLARVAASQTDVGAAALVSTYGRIAGEPFARAFGAFAAWTADAYGDRLTPTRSLAARGRASGSVAPFSIHYLRLPRTARTIELRFLHGRGEATLSYDVPDDRAGYPALTRRISPHALGDGRTLTFAISDRLRQSGRLETPRLAVANGSPARAVAYRVSVR